MRSNATTVAAYLRSLPPERRRTIAAVRRIIKKNLPAGYTESMQYGMIGYGVPVSRYPAGYRGDIKTPLPYIALASQKHYMALYLMGVYGNDRAERLLRDTYATQGKKLDMGKCCLRFKTLEELPLPVIGTIIASLSVAQFIKKYEAARTKK